MEFQQKLKKVNKVTRKKYRFDDFTLENYKKLLKIAKENYMFVPFSINSITNPKEIFLRHDIEFSINIALEMAKIESALGIQATYLLQVHGDFYNALERRTINTIDEIIGLGHIVGLHFDSHYWGCIDEKDLEKCMKIDKKTLETYLGININVFSFHNTNEFILSCDDEQYAGMINPYSKFFKEKVGYCSDSTGIWRYEILEERLLLAEDVKLQILIHDGMWSKVVLPPRQRIYNIIDDHATYMKNSYDLTLKQFKAKNIDWDGEV